MMNGDEPSSGSIAQFSQRSPLNPVLSLEPRPFPQLTTELQPSQQPHESAAPSFGWQTIGERQDFYDERDCLHPSFNLVIEKLNNRGADDVVIFDYSLDPDYLTLDGDSSDEEDGPPLEHSSADDDLFFRVSRNELLESEEFGQIIGSSERRPSRGPRLGIIDFPQCYDTWDDSLLYAMGKKLSLQQEGKSGFMDVYLRRVRELPGHRRFRTGISLWAPSKGLPGLPRSRSSEHRFLLFVSFPYFGGSSQDIRLDPESETVRLLDFGRVGIDVPDRSAIVDEKERDDIRRILVHQARYLVFDNNLMATFRSKEDTAKDRAPLHRFQERIGAFRAMTHMIANCTELELRTLEKLQASLCKLGGEIHQMISDARAYRDDWGMKREQDRIQDLLTSLDVLAASSFAAISVAERQIVVLQDLHSVFLTSYRTKSKDYEKGYPLRQNPFHRNILTIPILSENPQQIWPNTLDTIDEVVRERKYFIKKVKGLVENMDIRRKIFSAFLKSDQAKAAPSEKTAQETAGAVKRTEDAVKKTQAVIEKAQAELVQQGQTLTSFTIVTTAFLPLSFCTSYFSMQTMKEFGDSPGKLSLRQFWLATGPTLVGVLLLTVMIVLWKRPVVIALKANIKKKLSIHQRKMISDIEKRAR
ncbi:hypothetical protein B9Z19DRAFT_682159 [Tuber borchii]|uniref:Uncharacterized protein n=1 Tax=Tuber borchii TaxID=42251 RepID=A0A2T6ZZC5_TUBBO|nr:hypothetical protein B9Z19DRAFT_682159 [Tuber borchii]